MNRLLRMIIIGLVVVLLSGYGIYKLMNLRTFQLFGNLTYKVNTQEKVVALTIDDGPSEYTEDILKILNTYIFVLLLL